MRAEVAAVPAERRISERTAIECPARLHLTTGLCIGALLDLSRTGARIRVPEPPTVGAEVLLKWQSHEAFCKVVWAKDGMCGVAFDRPLSAAMLDESLQAEAARPIGPIAAVSNIPLGQKRSRL